MRQYFILAYIHVAIPYRTAKFKSANIFAIAIWGPTAKFNSRQYFRLYGIMHVVACTQSLIKYPETQAQPKLMVTSLQNKMWEKHGMLILRMSYIV